jgi:hypothetical protein
MPFRVLGMVALGVVLGFVLGGLAPRAQLADRERELAALKKRVERFDRPSVLGEFFPAFARSESGSRGKREPASAAQREGGTANQKPPIPDAREPQVSKTSAAPSRALGGRVQHESGALESQVNAAAPGSRDPENGDDDSEERAEATPRALDMSDFDKLVAVQRLRIAASRSALIEQATLSEQEVVQLDRQVAKMNEELSSYGEEIVQQATAEQMPPASQVLGLGHDLSGIMLEGQQGIDKMLGERAAGVDREAKEIWNYVDVSRMREVAEQLLPKNKPPNLTDDEQEGP